jgi:hypothetical protein
VAKAQKPGLRDKAARLGVSVACQPIASIAGTKAPTLS